MDIDILIAALEVSKKQGNKKVFVIDEQYTDYDLRVAFHNAQAHLVVSPNYGQDVLSGIPDNYI